jgi:hypothetical protein
MDHVFNGTFGVDRRSLAWVPEGAHYNRPQLYALLTAFSRGRRVLYLGGRLY